MRRYTRLVGEERAAMIRTVIELYAAGMSIEDVRLRCSLSFGTVHRMLTEAGVPRRPAGVRSFRRTVESCGLPQTPKP